MIKIIASGKIKESYLKEAINDYTKRINKYHNIKIIEIPDTTLEEEKEKIKMHISKRDYVISLDIEGNKLSSIELANKIDKIFITNPCITFIIGSSNGLDDEIKKIANYSLSFSELTFPHGLFRLILLEQIYRSMKILNGESYHK